MHMLMYLGQFGLSPLALTNFSPATFALNDMLRQQLQLTTQFMMVNRRLHSSLIQSLDSSAFKYTTLKETKEVSFH